MSRKRKAIWSHIDVVKDGGSEFDSLGAVEELANYNDEDLKNILGLTNDDKSSPKKKSKKSKQISSTIETLETEQSTNFDKSKAEKEEVSIDCKGSEAQDDKKDEKPKKKKKTVKKKNKTNDKKDDASKEKSSCKEKEEVSIDCKGSEAQDDKKDEKPQKKKKTVKKKNKTNDKKDDASKEKSSCKEKVNTTLIDLSDLKDKWGNYGIPDEVFRALSDKKFTHPTEIQKACIPRAIGFKDVVGAAETGSGKTLAFGIPLVANIMKMKKRRSEKNKNNTESNLYGIVIAPTRELALQIQKHLKEITKYCNVTMCSVIGGLSPEKQERLLGYNPDIVVATPGRLMKMLSSGNEHLQKISTIRFLVIDECDRMFEKGHFAELTSILEKMNLDGRKVQKMVFSATLSLQQSTKKKFYDELCEGIGLAAKTDVVDLTTKRVTVEQLHQMKVICEDIEKEIYLLYFLLNFTGRTIVFSNTIACTDRLSRLLKVLEFKPLQLHAKKQQKQRLSCLDEFRDSKDGLLVCTDVAAHGLDIPEVDNVVHFQLPRDPKIYVHRCGRTARAKKEGRSLILNGSEDFEGFKSVMKLLKDNEIENMNVESLVYTSLKERMTLAKEIERKMYEQKKASSDSSWQLRMSRELELDTDVTINAELSRDKKALKGKQSQLKNLMQRNPVAEHQKKGRFRKSGTITISGLSL